MVDNLALSLDLNAFIFKSSDCIMPGLLGISVCSCIIKKDFYTHIGSAINIVNKY